MALTLEQIQAARARYGVPEQGFGSTTKPSSTDRLSRFQAGWSGQDQEQDLGQDEEEEEIEAQPIRPTKKEGFLDRIKDIPGDVIDIGKNIKKNFDETTDDIAENINRRAEDGIDALDVASTILDFGAGTYKTIADSVFEVGKGVVKTQLTQQQEDEIAATIEDTAEWAAETAPVKYVVSKWNEYEKENPEAAANIKAGGQFLSFLTDLAGLKVGSEAGKKVLDKSAEVINKTSEVVETAKQGDLIKQMREQKAQNAMDEIENAVNKIVQTKDPKELETASRALASIDTKGVKTYEELNEAMQVKLDALKKRVDAELEKDPTPISAKDWSTKTDVDGVSVEQNFVKDALDHLEEAYSKANDPVAATKIANLRDKLETTGLSRKEVNDLARDYGTEFKNKSFSKTGDPLTSVSAQAFETTRKGLKESVRSKMTDDITRQLDGEMSDILDTMILTKKMEERVLKMEASLKKVGVMEQIGNKFGSLLDLITAHSLRGALKGVGVASRQTNNAVEIEKELSKNISRMEQLIKEGDRSKLIDFIEEMLNAVGLKQKTE